MAGLAHGAAMETVAQEGEERRGLMLSKGEIGR